MAGGEFKWQREPRKKKKRKRKNTPRKIKDPLWLPCDSIIYHATEQQAAASRCVLWQDSLLISGSSRWTLQIELYIICLDSKSIKPHLLSALPVPSTALWPRSAENGNMWGRWSQAPAGFLRSVNDATRWGFSIKKKMLGQSDDAAAAGVTCAGVGMVNTVLVVWYWAEATRMSVKNVTKNWKNLHLNIENCTFCCFFFIFVQDQNFEGFFGFKINK